MMEMVLAAIRIIGPLLFRAAEAGTLAKIAETAADLFALIRPLLDDPGIQARLDEMATAVATTIRPAQPEDAVFARQGATHFGGR